MTPMTRVFLGLILSFAATVGAVAPTAAAPDWWQPQPGSTWQVQFSDEINMTVEADVFDLDAFDTDAAMVDQLHEQGRHVVCYVNAGAWENWRPDADRYPASVKGKRLEGWPGERWLDIRRLDVLKPIIRDRLEICREKGFDGVEFDNVDGRSNDTGFPLTRSDQLMFNRWLARAAHEAGLAVGLKNTLSLAEELEPSFDFALLEQCFQYRECGLAQPFIDAGKPVIDIEYSLSRSRFCAKADDLGMVAMKKRLALDAWRRTCI
jgi:hypothetical protein